MTGVRLKQRIPDTLFYPHFERRMYFRPFQNLIAKRHKGLISKSIGEVLLQYRGLRGRVGPCP